MVYNNYVRLLAVQVECQNRLFALCKEDNPDIGEVSQILACKVDVSINDEV